MARHSKHEEHEEHAGEAWLVAFADMMTLLMVTFLMMFAISALDLEKFRSFQQAFEQGLGKNTHALPAEGAPPEGSPRDVPIGSKTGVPTPTPKPIPAVTGTKQQRRDLATLKAELEKAISASGLTKRVSVGLEERGVVVLMTDGVLFDSGQARLLPRGQRLLDKLAPVLASVGNELDVEGHTDDRPIASAAFPSNWELSVTRATTVVRALLRRPGIDPDRTSASGFADTRPRVPNDSPRHRAVNRRVEVVVVVPPSAAPAPAAKPAKPAPKPAKPAPKPVKPAPKPTGAPPAEAPAGPAGEDHGEQDSGGH